MESEKKLRFAILVDDLVSWRAWEADSIAKLVARCGAVPVLVMVDGRRRKILSSIRVRNLAYYLFRIALMRPRAWRTVSSPDCIRGVRVHVDLPVVARGNWISLSHTGLAALREEKVDFVIRLGFGLLAGDVLTALPLGVWSLHHGDVFSYRGRPAAFWELLHGAPVVGVTLQRLTERLDGGAVIAQSWVETKRWSISHTLDDLYSAGSDLFARGCASVMSGQGVDSSHAGRGLGPVHKLPTMADVAKALVTMAMSAVSRVLFYAFMRKQWQVAVARRDAAAQLRLHNFVWDEAPPGWFRADPHLVESDGRDRLVFESFSGASGRGIIESAGIVGSGSLTTSVPLLDDPCAHLSFPGIVRDAERLWLVPERAERAGVWAYPLDPQSGLVVGNAICLLGDVEAVDPTLYRDQSGWWMFLTRAGRSSLSETWLYFADALEGPWTCHPQSPIVRNPQHARSAGPLYNADSVLVRPAQDCAGGYGLAVRLMAVKELTRNSYAEVEVDSLNGPIQGQGRHGIHTVVVGSRWVAIDGCTHKFDLFAGLERLVHRRRAIGRKRDVSH